MTSKGIVKCRFCDWSRPAMYTTKGGRFKRGVDVLYSHVEDEHEDEFEAIVKQVRHEVKTKHRIARRIA